MVPPPQHWREREREILSVSPPSYLNAPRTVFKITSCLGVMIMAGTAPENNGIHYTVYKVPLQPTNKGFVFMGVVRPENWGLLEDHRSGGGQLFLA